MTLTAMSLSACSNSGATSPTSTGTTSDILTMTMPPDVTAAGVVTAAVILRAGSVEEAVANGTVTPAEVDLARQAVAEGKLALWAQRAEADLK
jgi:hypothetical protein